MAALSLTTAFSRYGAKLTNHQWAVSALSENGELVISIWSHYLKPNDGKLRCTDKLSRWQHNKPGNNLLREHLLRAVDEGLPVRMVIARTKATTEIDAGADASSVPKTFGVREDLVGKVVSFDGDNFVIDFEKATS